MYIQSRWFVTWLLTKVVNQLAWYTLAISVGKYRTEAAKMMGITPAWLTLSGMYVLPPVVIRRPTTRFAYCTGIRRWPSWTKTMPTITASAMNGIITTNTWSGFDHHFEMPGT